MPPRTPGQAVTVSAGLAQIDRSLRLAVAERNRCLRAWSYSPNADTYAALDTAQAELDRKLEQRFAAQ